MNAYPEVGPVEPLPAAWKKSVIHILKTGTTDREIKWRAKQVELWLAFGDWQADAYPYMVSALEKPNCQGKRWFDVEKQEGGGEAYDFLFSVPKFNFPFYGKLCLLTGKLKIKVISAHKAGRDEL